MGIAFFKGAVKDFDASLVDGKLAGAARIESLETKDENLHAHLLVAGVLRRRAATPRSRSPASSSPAGDGVEIDGEITIKGVTKPAVAAAARSPGPSPTRTATRATGSTLETTIDRTEFGLNWNADMPDGTKALANEVTLKAELSLVAAA